MAALGDPTRASIALRLAQGPAPVSDLAEPFPMSLRGVLNHVQVLESAGVVRTQKVGRERRCELEPAALDEITSWLHQVRGRWERRLDAMDTYLKGDR